MIQKNTLIPFCGLRTANFVIHFGLKFCIHQFFFSITILFLSSAGAHLLTKTMPKPTLISSSILFSLLSKQTAIEIEQLTCRLVEAETKLKTEVARIKKKLQLHITELEMSLDVANKTNIELQKTIKKQSLQLTVS